jgi:O-antigen ligase
MFRDKLEKNFFYITIPSVLTTLIPFFLITGSLLTNISVSICSIIFLINSCRNKLYKFYQNSFFYFFFIFFLIMLISSIFSLEPLKYLKKSLYYLRFIFFSLSTWYLIEQNKKLLLHIFIVILCCFSFLIIDALIQYYIGQNIFGFKIFSPNRISSFFGDELVMGSYLSRLLPILICLYLVFIKNFNVKHSIFLILLLSLIGFLIFLSGERAALFYFVLFFFISMSIIKLFFVRISLVVSFFIILLIIYFNENVSSRIFYLSKYQLLEDKTIFFSSHHTQLYLSSFEIFLANNLWIGSGPGSFRDICYKLLDYKKDTLWFCSTHPHNTYLQALVELGIIGFIMIILALLFSIKIFLKKEENSLSIRLLSICFIISLFPLIPSGNLFGSWISTIYYYPVGIYLFLKNNQKMEL